MYASRFTLHRYILILAYDGTHYGGWQIQPNTTSIQQIVQEALLTALREPIHLTGSGRTDAGVHALAQVAHFPTEKPIDPDTLLAALRGLLPPDIRPLHLERSGEDFHARYSAKTKIYYYHLQLTPFIDPFRRLYSTHVPYQIDRTKLASAAQLFIGTHDFTSFANEAHIGTAARDPVRTLYRLDLIDEPGGIRLEFEGDGFLYKMVRNIVGTLIDVARGKMQLDEIEKILAAKDRRLAGTAAPAHGLFLARVFYPNAPAGIAASVEKWSAPFTPCN